MTECSAQLTFGYHALQPIVVRMDGPDSSSDGGVLLLRQIDEELGLTACLGRWLEDHRDPSRVVHSRVEQVRQRWSPPCCDRDALTPAAAPAGRCAG